MKAKLCVLLAAFLGIFSPSLLAGNLKVNLTPSQAVTAGAQWRVDGGAWRNSGVTVNNLSNGTHQVTFKAVTGWIAPVAANVTIVSGTITQSYAYIQASSLKITLSPASGQWRIDGGAWQASAATVANLAPGAHTVDYNAVSGYASPASENVALTAGQLTSLNRSYTQLAMVAVTLTPGTAQWRVDGGAWRASGTTAANLAVGIHTVDYAALSGYAAPQSESVPLTAGQNLTLTRTYVQLASLTVNLTPSSAQWRIDGGTWQNSGATVANLSIGSHSIDYAAASGYITPNSESIALAAGQALSLARAYVALPQLTLNLTPGAAQWQVDGGAWRASGSTATGLSVGSHSIAYATVAGYVTLTGESVSLAAGQQLALDRAYVQLAQLTVTLSNSAGQFRVDGGAWQPSGATVGGLTPGNHGVEYSILTHYQGPPSETVALTAGQSLPLQRSYVPLAQIGIGLVPAEGRWRANGGAWQTSGTVLWVVPGDYTVDYEPLPLYDPPASDTIALAAAGIFATTRYYVSQKPSLQINLAPNTGQWRIDGGGWQNSGATVADLDAGAHAVDYFDIGGDFDPLASETVNLALREHATLSRTYPFKRASVTVTLNPNVGATWRLDGPVSSGWQASGATVGNLTPAGNWTVTFENIPNYTAPASLAFALAPGQSATFTGTYTPLPASLRVSLSPATGQWRATPVGGTPGVWSASGVLVNGLAPGDYLVDYGALNNYVAPTTETISLAPNQALEFVRTYSALASLTVTLTPAQGQWRLDGGAWSASGTALDNLSLGDHLVEYSAVPDYTAPPAETVTLAAGPATLGRTYTADPAFAIVHAFDDAGNLPTAIRGNDGWIYVATNCGVTNGLGLLYKMLPDGSQRQPLLRFATDTVTGSQPKALLEGSDGLLYGTTLSGAGGTATVSNGTIYRVNRDGTGYALLYTFSSAGWGQPNTLIEGVDGALYGTTSSASGSGNNGKIFRLNKDGSGFTVLRSLFSSEGINPQGICQLPSGQLYVTNKTGGTNNLGTIYFIHPSGSSSAVIKSFTGGADGSDPRTRLTAGSDGMLYGTTAGGGSASKGIVFRLNPDGSGYQVLHNFAGATTDGSTAEGALIEQPDGMLYGTTTGGGANNRGTVYRLNKDGSGYAITKTITGAIEEGSGPRFNLVPLGDGRLLGATIVLGAATKGVFFTLNLDGSGFTTILQQGALGGAEPWSNVTEADGVLYGPVHTGGSGNNGTLYRVNRDGTGFTVLKAFSTTEGAAIPLAPLLAASDGFLYGSTYSPSKIFRLARDGSGYTVIQDLPNSVNGGAAWGGMVEASDGFVYGTTMGGGTAGYGVIFRFAKPGTGYTVLRSFANSTTDGGQPGGTLCEGLDGRLYGTTSTGGSSNMGTVFAINKDGTGFTVLHHFAGGADGSGTYAGVCQRADGTLFGTTTAGGSANLGTLFKLAPDGSGYAVVKSFTGGTADGSQPTYNGVVEQGGKLYGTTVLGGLFNAGTVYRINPDGSGFEILINFGAGIEDTSYPWAGLTKGSDGKLYGTGTRGPTSGAVYRLRVD